MLFAFTAIPKIVKSRRVSNLLVKRFILDLDLFGFALFAPAPVMFRMALELGSGTTYAWNSETIVRLLCGTGVAVLVFTSQARKRIT